MRPLLLSLKPIYADLLFMGLKKAELRRRIAQEIKGRDVLIYVSSPKRELRGGFTVGEVWTGTPAEVWEQVRAFAHVDRDTFDSYYEGSSVAFALSIEDAWEYEKKLDLEALREKFGRFVVPQSWRYLTADEHRSLCRMKRASVCPDDQLYDGKLVVQSSGESRWAAA